MGIQSTKYISREFAINRIKEVLLLTKESNYKRLENISNEENVSSLEAFVNNNNKDSINIDSLENYTDNMLEELLNKPFFRETVFDNYSIR